MPVKHTLAMLVSVAIMSPAGWSGDVAGTVSWGESTWDPSTGTGTVDVLWRSEATLAGFQFNVPPNACQVLDLEGLACDAAWSLHTNGHLVLGYAIAPHGFIEPSAEDVALIRLVIQADQGAEISFESPIFADPSANEIIIDATAVHVVGDVACPADIHPPGEGDGVVNVNEVLAVLADWGNTSGHSDVTGDGVVDVNDILAVLEAWGACG